MNTKLPIIAGITLATMSLSSGAFAAPQSNQMGPSNQELLDRINRLENELDETRNELQQTQRQSAVTSNDVADIKSAKPKSGWWENTSVTGRMYYNISHSEVKSNGAKTPATATGFDIKRFYVGIDHKFNKTFSANITTDFQYDSVAGATQVYIKKAYLDINLDKAFDIRLGSADLPWVPFVEDVYGYRYVENTLIDRTKFGTSADWGVHVSGKFDADGLKLGYQVSAIDGSGYKHPFRSKSIDLEGRINAEYQGFIVALGGYTGKLGKSLEGTPTQHTAQRFDALAAYKTNQIRVGVEYFAATDWNNVTTVAKETSVGVGPFASYQFDPQWSVFGKYEWVKPNSKTKGSLHDDYFNVGISYTPTKIVDFALVYKRDKAVNGTIATSNGTIGGSIDGTYDEVGLWGQVRW
jgi:hypothetical protein